MAFIENHLQCYKRIFKTLDENGNEIENIELIREEGTPGAFTRTNHTTSEVQTFKAGE